MSFEEIEQRMVKDNVSKENIILAKKEHDKKNGEEEKDITQEIAKSVILEEVVIAEKKERRKVQEKKIDSFLDDYQPNDAEKDRIANNLKTISKKVTKKKPKLKDMKMVKVTEGPFKGRTMPMRHEDYTNIVNKYNTRLDFDGDNEYHNYDDPDYNKQLEDTLKYYRQAKTTLKRNPDWKYNEQEVINLAQDIMEDNLFKNKVRDSVEDEQSLLHISKTSFQKNLEKEAKEQLDKLNKITKENVSNLNAVLKVIKDVDATLSELGPTLKAEADKIAKEVKKVNREVDDLDVQKYVDGLTDLETKINAFGAVTIDTSIDDLRAYDTLRKQYELLLEQSKVPFEKYGQYKNYYKVLQNRRKELKKDEETYNNWIVTRKELVKTYKHYSETQVVLKEDGSDLADFINIMSRNHHGAVQFAVYVGSAAADLVQGIEAAAFHLNPLTILDHIVEDMYDGREEDMPDLLKVLALAHDFKSQTRDVINKAVNDWQENILAKVEEQTSYHDIEDLESFGEYFLGLIGTQTPQIVLMIATGGTSSLVLLGASAMGNKFEEYIVENKQGANHSLPKMYLASMFTGTMEGVSERVTLGILTKTGLNLNNPLVRIGFRDAFRKIFNLKNIAKTVTANVGEGASEVIAQMSENFADSKVMGKNVSIYRGTEEAFVSGFLIGQTLHSPVIFKQMMAPFMSKTASQTLVENRAKILDLESAIEATTDLDVKADLQERWVKLVADNNNILQAEIDRVDDISDVDKNTLIGYDASKIDILDKIKKIALDNSLSREQQEAQVKDLQEEFHNIENQRTTLIEEIKVEQDIGTAIKTAKDVSTIKDVKVAETTREFEAIVEKDFKKDPNKIDEIKKSGAEGFITPDGVVYINKEAAKKVSAVSVGSHEILHGIVKNTLNAETRIIKDPSGKDVQVNITKEGTTLIESFITALSPTERGIVQKRIDDNYKYNPDGTEKAFEEYAEEYLTSFSDAVRKDQITFNDNVFTRIGRKFVDLFKGKGYEKLEFKEGRDVYNFLKDYTADIKKGKVRKEILAVTEGASVSDVVAGKGVRMDGAQFSKSGFADNIIVEDLGLAKSTKKIVAKNEELYNQIIKDNVRNEKGELVPSRAVKDALIVNNMPRVTALAKQAAEGAPVALETGLKKDFNDFYGEYSLKLAELAETYRPEKNASFGAYMNQLLPKKYSGILEKLKKGEIQGAKRIDREAMQVAAPTGPQLKVGTEIVVAARLGILNEVTRIVENNQIELHNPTYKTTKSLLTGKNAPFRLILDIVAKKFGIESQRIVDNSDLDKTQRRAAQQKIYKETDLIKGPILPEGFDASGKATGVPPTLLNAIDEATGLPNLIYTKTARAKMLKTGSAQGLPLQRKNKNIDTKKLQGVFGITPVGTHNNLSKKVDGPIKAVVLQAAMIVLNQTKRQVAEKNGNLADVISIKDGKSDLAFSITAVRKDPDIARQREFFNRADDVLRSLYPGFGKENDIKYIKKVLTDNYSDIYSATEINKIAEDTKKLLDKYNIKGEKTETMKDEAFREFTAEFEEELMDNVFKLLEIHKKASAIFDSDININRQRRTPSALGNALLKGEADTEFNEKGELVGKKWTIKEVAELMVVLQPAFSGNSQVGRGLFNHTLDGDVVQVKEIDTKKTNRKQSFSSVGDFSRWGVIPINGMTEAIWEQAKKDVQHKLRKQDAAVALKSVDSNGLVNEETESAIKKDAQRGRDALTLMVNFLHKSKNHTKLDIGMFMVSNLSHMESPLRRAAMFSDVAVGLNTPGHKNYVPVGINTPKKVSAWMKRNGFEGWEGVAKMKPTKIVKVKNPDFDKTKKEGPNNRKLIGKEVANKIPYRNKYTIVYEHAIPASDMAYRVPYYTMNNEMTDTFWDKYTVAIITKKMDDVLKNNGLQSRSNPTFNFRDPNSSQYDRYFGPVNYNEVAILPIKNIFTGVITGTDFIKLSRTLKHTQAEYKGFTIMDNAVKLSRTAKDVQGMSAWDFDDTIARTKSGVRYTLPNPEGTPQPGRKVIFMAGGPGSGKSNVIKQLDLEKQGFKTVNQDISLQWLAKNHGLPTDMRDFTPEQASKWGELGWDARMIAKRKQTKYQGKGDGIIVDGTGNSLKMMNQHVREFESKGYDVQMIFVETSLETALERNRVRKERSLRSGIVIKTHESVQKNKEAFKEMFGERFAEVNTDKLKQNDPMPSKLAFKLDNFTRGYIKGRLDPGEYADKGADLEAQGAKFDFTEFDIVKEGEKGPLFSKAMDRAKKFGLKDQFILTARPHAAKISIFRFLAAQGLNIPFDNIVTLESSTAESKALWIAEKVGEGYNDIYFADDALQNIKAVQNMLDQFDVKSKVQQAKIKFSKSMDPEFNKILEETKGIPKEMRFSEAKAKQRGKKIGKYQIFIPPSADDFAGLLMNFYGKGKEGMQHAEWFKKALLDPFAKGYRDLNAARQKTAGEYKTLIKKFPNVKKKLQKEIPTKDFTYGDAVRVYLWTKAGFEVPGLSKTDKNNMVKLVSNDMEIKTFADGLGLISEGYTTPGEYWMTQNITSDLETDGSLGDGRKKHLEHWIQNKNIIFSKENLNKIEAVYGSNFREALEDILYRMENGTNRNFGQNRIVNDFLNWLNGGISVVMNWNSRSAVLQTLSTVNFVNWGDNNIAKAAARFADIKQFSSDFATIFNSDMLKQRRTGLRTSVASSEIAAAMQGSTNKVRAIIRYLLKIGFIPTKIADSFAIAMGGATFYRNRINTYLKQGMAQKEAESQAWLDFQEIAEETQQSSRPDRISQQQASPLGRLILAFQNTPMQYMRLTKKEALDLANGRFKGFTGPNSFTSKVGKITYYAAVQNLIFYSMQTALFAMLYGDDEDDDEFIKKKQHRVASNMADGILRGIGVGGAVISTIKNMMIKHYEQKNKSYNYDESAVLMEGLKLSPPLSIKARQLLSAEKTTRYNEDVIKEMETFDIDNPMWSAIFNVIEAATNIPTARMHNKFMNVREALDQQHAAWQRLSMFFGWNRYDVGVESLEVQEAKERVKIKKKEVKKVEAKKKEIIKKQEEQKVNEIEQEKEIEEGKEVKCIASTKDGRCGLPVVPGNKYCTVHQKVKQRESGKETICTFIKPNGKKCKMPTKAESGLCYYHD